MAELNATIIDRVSVASSNDYQQRVPKAAAFASPQDGVKAVLDFLTEPMNGRYWNEFQEGLITLIGVQRARQVIWSNQLAEFKGSDFVNGKGVQEYGFPLIDALQYNPAANNFLERHKIPVKSAFHSVNRRVVYPFTVNSTQLRQSFNQEGGINTFLNGVLNAALLSNQYDEYRLMLSVFAEFNQKYPIYNIQVNVANLNSPTKEEIENLAIAVRKTALDMSVAPTGKFNAFGIPNVSNIDDIVLLLTPTVVANMDVKNLASAFNVSYADFKQRVIVVDELPWGNALGLLVAKDAVIAGDSLVTIENFRNARSLEDNYYFHVQGGYSLSPMANIAVISTSAGSQLGLVTVALTGIDADFRLGGQEVTTVKPGTSDVVLTVTPTGTVTGAKAAKFLVPGTYTASVKIDGEITTSYYVDLNGYLHVPYDAEVGTEIEVTATAAYYNPSAPVGTPTTLLTSTATVTVASTVTFVPEEEDEEPVTP